MSAATFIGSPAVSFKASPCIARTLVDGDPFNWLVNVAAVWPYEGFGNTILTISSPTGFVPDQYNDQGAFGVSLGFDISDKSATCQRLNIQSGYTGFKQNAQQFDYSPFWVNGFGLPTFVAGDLIVTGSDVPDTWGIFPDGHGQTITGIGTGTYTATETFDVYIFPNQPGPGHSPDTTITFVLTITLSQPIHYADVRANTLLALKQPFPPNGGDGSERTNLIYPDTATSTVLVQWNDPTFSTNTYAGMTAGYFTKFTDGIISFTYLASSKALWNYGYAGGTFSETEFYFVPLDSVSGAQGARQLCFTMLPGNQYVVTPQTDADLNNGGHLGSDYPPNFFAGSGYAPPYAPGGNGQMITGL